MNLASVGFTKIDSRNIVGISMAFLIQPVLVTIKPSTMRTVKSRATSPVKNQKWIKKDAHDRFPEPLYERPPRFEGGIRWEQGGSPGLGKKR